VGGVRERPVVVEGRVVPRPTSWLTLCADHGALDGQRAADLLASIKDVLQSDELVREAREATVQHDAGSSGVRDLSACVGEEALATGAAAR
jgi:hypothetical protein